MLQQLTKIILIILFVKIFANANSTYYSRRLLHNYFKNSFYSNSLMNIEKENVAKNLFLQNNKHIKLRIKRDFMYAKSLKETTTTSANKLFEKSEIDDAQCFQVDNFSTINL